VRFDRKGTALETRKKRGDGEGQDEGRRRWGSFS